MVGRHYLEVSFQIAHKGSNESARLYLVRWGVVSARESEGFRGKWLFRLARAVLFTLINDLQTSEFVNDMFQTLIEQHHVCYETF